MSLPHIASPSGTAENSRWFRAEVLPHESALRSYLRQKFPTLSDLEDVIQEAYARLMRAREAGTIAEPRAYLFATARNAALDLFRRRHGVALEALEDVAPTSVVEEKPDAAETACRHQEIDLLLAAIDDLPPRCREILRLRKFEHLSYREIAQRLGITENTVNAHLGVALVRCRQFLEARGVLRGGGHV